MTEDFPQQILRAIQQTAVRYLYGDGYSTRVRVALTDGSFELYDRVEIHPWGIVGEPMPRTTPGPVRAVYHPALAVRDVRVVDAGGRTQ